MRFNEHTVAFFQYLLDTIYGIVITFLLADVPPTKKNIRAMVLVAGLCFGVVSAAIFIRGLHSFSRVYALSVHLPVVLFLILGFRRPVSTTLLALCLTYFTFAPKLLLGNLAVAFSGWLRLPLDAMIARRIGWMLSTALTFWPIYRFFVPPIRELIRHAETSRSALLILVGSCYLFAQISFGFLAQPLRVSLLTLFLIGFLVSLVGYSRKQRQLEETRTRMAAYSAQNEGLALYAESMAGYLEDTARLRHDHRHFLTLLDLQAARGDLEAVRRLIDDSLATLDASPERVTGSSVVDAIVALFRKRAGEQGVAIELSGKGLLSLPLPENELCLLLSNCLDNAIGAAKLAEAGERVISISISTNAENGASSLAVRNPCATAVSFAPDGLPLSGKGPGHGYGTSSMQTIVKKHGGLCGFSVERGEFIFRAAFLPPRTDSAKPTPAAARPANLGGHRE